MDDWRVSPPARPASTRVDGFAAAKKARKANAATGINPAKLRRLKNADCAVCFVFIWLTYGRGAGVGRGRGVSAGLGVGEGLGVKVAVAVGVALGVAVGVALAVVVGLAVGVVVGVGVGPDCAQYLPPVFKSLPGSLYPPQTIISVPVQTAVCASRPTGAVVAFVGLQVSALRLYLPPVFKKVGIPPQTIISVPVHTAVWESRVMGALVVLVGIQLFVPGLSLPPVLKKVPMKSVPPQTIISLPVQTAV